MSLQTTNGFLDKIPETNTEWAAQQIALNYESSDFIQLHAYLVKLDSVLYKSWAKDLPFSEIISAVAMVLQNTDITPTIVEK